MKKKTIGKEYIFTALILFVVLAVTMVLDSQLPGYHIVIKVIKKASVYSLVAVSMILLNGFTGLFSLGQAGFMLLGAYSYAVLCIPVAKRAGVYQYFDGGIVKFSLPEIFASFLGDKVGSAVGMILALLVGGLIAAFFAYLIGLPVLRLKSDYLAIATLGFAEIMRTIIQWNAIGPLTNASNLLKGYPDFSSATAYLLLIGVFGSLGQAFITYAYRFAPASEISIYNYSGIIFSMILGFFILGEPVKFTSVIGGALVAAASVMVYVYNNRSNKKAGDETTK